MYDGLLYILRHPEAALLDYVPWMNKLLPAVWARLEEEYSSRMS